MSQRDHQAIDILLAEIDIYELFAFKHCKGRRVKLALCDGNLLTSELCDDLCIYVLNNGCKRKVLRIASLNSCIYHAFVI